jgi:hypothetical protein
MRKFAVIGRHGRWMAFLLRRMLLRDSLGLAKFFRAWVASGAACFSHLHAT